MMSLLGGKGYLGAGFGSDAAGFSARIQHEALGPDGTLKSKLVGRSARESPISLSELSLSARWLVRQ